MHKVGLARGGESFDAVKRALDLVRGEVKVPADRPVLIKPNFVSPTVELCATPVGAVRATLEFLAELGVKKFILAEGAGQKAGDTMAGFRRYGYLPLQDDFDIEFRNLHEDDKVVLEALNEHLEPVEIRLAKSLFTSYVVSVARLKTHIRVIVTMSLKNIGIGAIHNPDRHAPPWHQPVDPHMFSHEPRPINLSLARLCQAIPIHLAVVDGVVGMEGNGPVLGNPVNSGVALAGTEALAVDLVGAELMGFDVRTIGYLWYLSRLRKMGREDIQVIGEELSKYVIRYVACDNFQETLSWWVPDWEKYLQGTYLKNAPSV